MQYLQILENELNNELLKIQGNDLFVFMNVHDFLILKFSCPCKCNQLQIFEIDL